MCRCNNIFNCFYYLCFWKNKNNRNRNAQEEEAYLLQSHRSILTPANNYGSEDQFSFMPVDFKNRSLESKNRNFLSSAKIDPGRRKISKEESFHQDGKVVKIKLNDQSILTVQNACAKLIRAELRDHVEEKETIIRFIGQHVDEIMKSSDWRNMNDDHPVLVTEIIRQVSGEPPEDPSLLYRRSRSRRESNLPKTSYTKLRSAIIYDHLNKEQQHQHAAILHNHPGDPSECSRSHSQQSSEITGSSSSGPTLSQNSEYNQNRKISTDFGSNNYGVGAPSYLSGKPLTPTINETSFSFALNNSAASSTMVPMKKGYQSQNIFKKHSSASYVPHINSQTDLQVNIRDAQPISDNRQDMPVNDSRQRRPNPFSEHQSEGKNHRHKSKYARSDSRSLLSQSPQDRKYRNRSMDHLYLHGEKSQVTRSRISTGSNSRSPSYRSNKAHKRRRRVGSWGADGANVKPKISFHHSTKRSDSIIPDEPLRVASSVAEVPPEELLRAATAAVKPKRKVSVKNLVKRFGSMN